MDLDGTLVDTRPHMLACIKYTLSQIGENADTALIASSIKSSLDASFRSILPPTKWQIVEECVLVYRSYQKDHLEEELRNIEVYPSVKDTLQVLSSYSLAIVTGKPAWLADRILLGLDLRHFFSTIVGVDEVSRDKPFPDAILLALSRLGDSRNAMIVGDSVVDVQAGKNAQILTCAVEYGFTQRENLLAANPDFTIPRFSDLIKILKDPQ